MIYLPRNAEYHQQDNLERLSCAGVSEKIVFLETQRMEREICMWKGRKAEQPMAGRARRAVGKSSPCPQICKEHSERGG